MLGRRKASSLLRGLDDSETERIIEALEAAVNASDPIVRRRLLAAVVENPARQPQAEKIVP